MGMHPLMTCKHKRKDGYWLCYHLAHTLERDMIIKNIVSLVKENPPSRPKNKSNRGRKPIHSWEKLVCICILMVVFGSTYRDIQNIVMSLNLPWNNNEPYPNHLVDITYHSRKYHRRYILKKRVD